MFFRFKPDNKDFETIINLSNVTKIVSKKWMSTGEFYYDVFFSSNEDTVSMSADDYKRLLSCITFVGDVVQADVAVKMGETEVEIYDDTTLSAEKYESVTVGTPMTHAEKIKAGKERAKLNK